MNFDNPWENITIQLVDKDQDFQFYDTTINILYVLSGNSTFSYDKKNILLKRSDFVIIPKAKLSHVIINEAKVFLCKFSYTISLDKLKKYYYVFEGDSVESGSSKSVAVINTLQKIIQSYIFKDERPRFRTFQYYFELLALLEENFCRKEKAISSDSIYNKVEALSAYILTNCENEIKLSEIAKRLYVSEQYLSRMFREFNGVSLSEFIVNCRMEKVTDQLITTDKTITDVAFSSGFTNINSFNRLFKNRYNMTPKEFRVCKSLDIKDVNDETDKSSNMNNIKALLKESEVLDECLKINIEEGELVNTPYTPFLIGLGKINQLSQEPLFSQMNELELLGFSYARINGWVDNDIMISNSTYDFFRIDLIIKKLLSMNIKPYIEINVYEGLVKKKMLLSRINCLFNHFVSTYGYEEIKGWMVDIVSNKSRDDGLQYVNELSTKEQLEFFELFKEVKSSIKEIVPDIKVGGGGIRLDYFYKPFINDFYSSSKKSNVFPDYLSVSLFQYDKKNSKENDEKFEKKISPDPNFMRRKTADLKKELSLVGFEVNISIVDFNITFSNYDIINDTSFKGTFIIKNILEMMDNCSLIGYGSFFDYSLRNEINYEKEIFGGRGLLSMNGLPKAGYFAFLFMINAFLYKTKKDIDFIISKNEDSSIVNIVMFNYVHLGINYYYDSSTFHKYNIYTAFDGSKETVYNIDLSNIININKKHKVLIKRLGQMHGSFMDEVNKYTNEDNLVQEDIKYLKECIRPVRRIQYLDCEKMKCSIDVKINKHEIVYITIQQI